MFEAADKDTTNIIFKKCKNLNNDKLVTMSTTLNRKIERRN